MKKMSKKFISLLAFLALATISHADSALISSFWSSNTTEKVVGNCTIRNEYNPYTQQYTANEVCFPRSVSVPNTNKLNYTPDTYYSGISYNSGPALANYQGYYTGNNAGNSYGGFNASQYLLSSFGNGGYTGTNSYLNSFYAPSRNGGYWNTGNNYGYYNEGLFNTYYRGGPSDYSGYYQPGYYQEPGDMGGVDYNVAEYWDQTAEDLYFDGYDDEDEYWD